MSLDKLEVQYFEFGNFRLIPEERLLLSSGEPLTLPPKVFDALLLLVENEGHLIEKNDFLDRLWADAFVEEATLTRTISTLRKELDETPENKYIETIPKSGYRFIAPVRSFVKDKVPTFSNKISSPPVSPSKQFLSRPILLFIGLAFVAFAIVILTSWNWQAEPKKEIKSVAVLPFQQIGAEEHDEMLEFGMTDTLITRLSNLEGIVVRPTSAVSKYLGQKNDTVKIGRELRVDAVLEGSIQHRGEKIWVNVQLISTADGSSLWAEQFDTDFTNIFTVQDVVSRQAVQRLSRQLSGREQVITAKYGSDNADANRLYMTGRYFWNKRTVEGLQKSVGYFEQTLEKDPKYALAYAGLADSYQLLAEYLAVTPKEGFTKAKQSALKALKINGSLAEAHTSLAYTLAFYDWDWDGAEREFKRAIELNPNYATGHQWYGEFLAAMGRFDEAKTEFDKAAELDPTSLIIQTDLAAYYFLTRQFDDAVRQSNRVIEMDPEFAYGYVFLWFSLGQKGSDREAAEAYIKSVELFGEKNEADELRKVLAGEGTKAMWENRIEQAAKSSKKEKISAMWRALFYVRTGEKQKALDWLEKSYEERDRWVINLRYSPETDSLRSEKRFQRLIERIGL